MEEDINPSDSIPGDNDVIPSEGNENDSQIVEQAVSQADTSLTLEEINKTLGRNYADKPTALRALQETYSHVGKLGQKVSELETKVTTPVDVTGRLAEMQRDLKETKFYAENPEYNNPDAKALIAEMGGDPEQVVQKETFKKAYNAIKTTTENEKSKSVLHSNPRLGQVTDKLTQAKEAQKAGSHTDAATLATQAVMEAYDIGT